MRRWIVLLFFLTPAFSANWFIPSVTNAGSRVTELRVVNQGNAAAEVQFQTYLPAGQTAPAAVKMTVAPGASLLLPDALGVLFGVKETTAGLQISAGQPLLISARGSGTGVRSSVPVVADSDALRAGEAGHFLWIAQNASIAETFAVSLLGPQNSATLTVYDAAGVKLGTQTFSGGPQLATLALRTLVKTDAPLGRAFFAVAQGKAACHLLAVDQISGDTTVTTPQQYFEGPTDILIPGAVHVDRDDGQVLRTDLRLYNFSATAARITGGSATINLPAHGLTEIRDAGAAGALHLVSDQPVLIQARQVLGLPDGSAGFTGDTLPSRVPTDLLPAGAVMELAGVLPPSVLSFAAGPAGAAADVTVRDAAGTILAQSPDAVIALDPGGYTEMTLGDLFPDVTFSDETIVDVHVSGGSLVAQQSVIDPATSDRAIESAAPMSIDFVCAAPAIADFSAYPAAITAAGPVELDWSTDADYVQLTPTNVTMPAAGSMNVTVPAAGATYTLEAFNACGSAKLTLPVLPLGNAGTLSVTPAAAKPGQTITIHFGQQDLTGMVGVEFVFNGTLQYVAAIESTDDKGDVIVQVPAIPDPAKPTAMIIGAAVLRPSIPDNTGLKGPNFTVQPLTYTGNAIAELRQLIAYMTDQAHTTFKSISAAYSNPQDLAASGALIDQYAQILNKIADDLTARGTATAPVDVPTKTYPNPDTFTITTADLQDVLAYLHAVAGTDQLVPTLSVQLRPRIDSKQGACVKDSDPFYNACLQMSLLPFSGVGKSGADGLWGFLKDGLGKLFGKLVDAAQMACYLAPLVPQSFRVGANDFVLPGKTEDKQMIGQLGPYWTKQGLMDSIVAGAAKGFAQQYATDIVKGVPKATAQKRYDDGIAAAKKQAQSLADAAASIAGGVTGERTFGRCELTDVAVATNFRKNLQRKYDEERDPRGYRFKGKKQGEGNLEIFIDPTEFVNFHRPSGGQTRSDYQKGFKAPISVGKPKRTVTINQFYAYLSPMEKFNLGGLPVTLRDGQSYQGTITIVGNKYVLKVKSIEQGVFRLDLTITRVDGNPGTPRCFLAFSAQREANVDNDQQVVVEMSSSGNTPSTGAQVPAPSTAMITGAASVNKGGSANLNVSKQNGASLSQQAQKLVGAGATSMTANATIEAKGYGPNIVFSTIIRLEDDPE